MQTVMCPHCKRSVGLDHEYCFYCGRPLVPGGFSLVDSAPVSQRFGAMVIEGILLLLTAVGAGIVSGLVHPVLGLAAFAAFIIWMLVLWSDGRSPGKLLLGLRVVKTSGEPAGFGTMFLRETIGKFVSGLPLYLGYIWALLDDNRQAWHDKIADTYVVNDRSGG